MRRHLRDVIDVVRGEGGDAIVIDNSKKHTRVTFTKDGRSGSVLIHRGAKTLHYELPRLRSQVRRAIEGR